jgi:poly-gamma-glutamate synthesis protein (capsule biosynthesis protein)
MRLLVPFACSLGLASCFAWALVTSGVPAKPAEPAPPPPETVVLGVGDILLGRQLGEEMARTGDYTLAFRDIRETLASADITFGNLEGPFCAEPPYPASGMIFRFRPPAVESLVRAGFDVVSVANNHIGDGGDACLGFTLDHLRAAGIAPAGAGRTFEEAHAPAIVERSGVRFAFLAYTYAARNDQPGSNRLVVAGRDAGRVRRDVAAARELADVVIVSLHDGAEYTARVAPETQEFARAAIEAGATAVFGHHPHVPQRVEAHRDGWIFYSLGNFVFQQNSPPETRTSLVVRLTFSGGRLARVEAVPAVIEWFAQPRLANEREAQAILKSIGAERVLLWAADPHIAGEAAKK